MKKIIILFFVFVLSFGNAFSLTDEGLSEYRELQEKYTNGETMTEAESSRLNEFNSTYQSVDNAEDVNQQYNQDVEDLKNRISGCEDSWNCIDQPSFKINVWSVTPWNLWMEWESIEERTNWVLGTIIQRMMIALWVLSVLMMTIWAWYIILNNWQDELLSKWKSIFMSWIYSILIALASYYLVAIIRYMLFA